MKRENDYNIDCIFHQPDGRRVLERVTVNFDFARSKTFTSNFINIFTMDHNK